MLRAISTNSTACKDENDDLQKASLSWIEVNEVTHKLTDGVMERVPASHGQWGGFNTERGIAWAMESGGPFKKVAWFARYRDVCYGPTDSETAKQAAVAFTKGATSFPRPRPRNHIHRSHQSQCRSDPRGRATDAKIEFRIPTPNERTLS